MRIDRKEMFLSFLTLLVFVSSRKIAVALDPLSGIALSRINFNVNNEYIYMYVCIKAVGARDSRDYETRLSRMVQSHYGSSLYL